MKLRWKLSPSLLTICVSIWGYMVRNWKN